MGNLPWQLELTGPAWLAALAVLPLVIYYWRRSLVGFSRWQQAASLAARTVLIVLLVLALCGPERHELTRQQFVVFAVDQSLSITDVSRKRVDAFLDEAARCAGSDRAALLPFAAEPGSLTIRKPGSLTTRWPGGTAQLDPQGSDLAAAILLARASIPPECVPQIVLLSDGNQTHGDALQSAKAAGVPISTVPLEGLPQPEVYVSAVVAPQQVRQGEPFDLEVVLRSAQEDQGTLRLCRGSQGVAQQRAKVVPGENRFRFTESVPEPGLATFTARIEGFRDTLPGNNQASAVVYAAAPARAMLVEGQPASAGRLASALQGAKIEVDLRTPEDVPLRLDALQHYDLLILSNVPASSLPQPWMEAVQSYVKDFGGGLIVLGGDQAFTPGGYRGSILEEILPVWCRAGDQREKPDLAMVLVIDRSESMRGQRIELAKQAARRAVEMLGPKDQVGVIVFDDDSSWVSQIHPCSDKEHVLRQIDTITAEGQTNMYPAMEKAYLALDEAYAELKHMIVLTDGISHVADFEGLTRTIAASGITVSTVAVGQEAAGAALERIARAGKGHYYYCNDPASVPQIFALETIIAGKVGVSEGPFFPQPAGAGRAVAGLELDHLPTLLGCAQTRPKPDGQVILTAAAGDPLLAWWRYGRGISVAFTSDVQSRWAAAWLQWPGFDRFWVQLARHAMRSDRDQGKQAQLPQRSPIADYPEELRVRPADTDLLRSIARATAGRYDPKPSEIFAPSQRTVPRTTLLWSPLLAAAAVTFVVDVALRRIKRAWRSKE